MSPVLTEGGLAPALGLSRLHVEPYLHWPKPFIRRAILKTDLYYACEAPGSDKRDSRLY